MLTAPADGYTLLAAVSSTFTILPAQKDKLPFDGNRDFIPIGLTGHEGLVIASSPKLSVNTLGDLIALAKKDPHKIIIGTNPAGTLPHLAAQLLVEGAIDGLIGLVPLVTAFFKSCPLYTILGYSSCNVRQ